MLINYKYANTLTTKTNKRFLQIINNVLGNSFLYNLFRKFSRHTTLHYCARHRTTRQNFSLPTATEPSCQNSATMRASVHNIFCAGGDIRNKTTVRRENQETAGPETKRLASTLTVLLGIISSLVFCARVTDFTACRASDACGPLVKIPQRNDF